MPEATATGLAGIFQFLIAISLINVIGNAVSGITGTSPVTATATSLINTVFPIYIQMIPFMMVMSMINRMMMPFMGGFYW